VVGADGEASLPVLAPRGRSLIIPRVGTTIPTSRSR
jgi:hypothetical protein